MKPILDRFSRLVRRARPYRDLWAAGLLTAAAFYSFSGHFSTVRFEQERIHVRLEGSQIRVTGHYFYRNDSYLPAILTLGVPFPTDMDHALPNVIRLVEEDESFRWIAELPFLGNMENLRLRLLFGPNEGKWIRVEYTQYVLRNEGRYLLTTTRAWHRPIRLAEFELELPPDWIVLHSNYALGPLSQSMNANRVGFSRREFWPHEDWVFRWSRPNERLTTGAK